MRAITVFGEIVGIGAWILGSATLFATGIARFANEKGSPGWNGAMVGGGLLMMALFFTGVILLADWITS